MRNYTGHPPAEGPFGPNSWARRQFLANATDTRPPRAEMYLVDMDLEPVHPDPTALASLCEKLQAPAGGEYQVPVGFGWVGTAAVDLAMKNNGE